MMKHIIYLLLLSIGMPLVADDLPIPPPPKPSLTDNLTPLAPPEPKLAPKRVKFVSLLSEKAPAPIQPVKQVPIIENPYVGNTAWLDVFGIGSWSSDRTFQAGTGISATYFFSEYFGVQAETSYKQVTENFGVSGNIVLRYPIKDLIIAPYLIGGGGTKNRSLGGGLRVALDHDFDFFLEGRYRWGEVRSPEVRFGIGFRFW